MAFHTETVGKSLDEKICQGSHITRNFICFSVSLDDIKLLPKKEISNVLIFSNDINLYNQHNPNQWYYEAYNNLGFLFSLDRFAVLRDASAECDSSGGTHREAYLRRGKPWPLQGESPCHSHFTVKFQKGHLRR